MTFEAKTMKVFDIFGRLPDGKPLWIESVEDLGIAEQQATRFSEIFRGECFVYSERDGLIVKRIERARTMN